MVMTTNRSRIPKASDVVVAALRHKILSERLDVGTRLPSESELMDEYGFGRVSVREALRILERDGLVDVRRGPHGGIFVRHTDIGKVSEALALMFSFRDTTLGEFATFRLHVEPMVARLAAQNGTPEARAELLKDAKADLSTKASADLHGRVADLCGNDVFELVMKAMHVSLAGHFRHELISPEHYEATARAHVKIATAIAAGDGDAAEKAMQRHLEVYRDYLKDVELDEEPIVPRS